jgi:hypothetical protein
MVPPLLSSILDGSSQLYAPAALYPRKSPVPILKEIGWASESVSNKSKIGHCKVTNSLSN